MKIIISINDKTNFYNNGNCNKKDILKFNRLLYKKMFEKINNIKIINGNINNKYDMIISTKLYDYKILDKCKKTILITNRFDKVNIFKILKIIKLKNTIKSNEFTIYIDETEQNFLDYFTYTEYRKYKLFIIYKKLFSDLNNFIIVNDNNLYINADLNIICQNYYYPKIEYVLSQCLEKKYENIHIQIINCIDTLDILKQIKMAYLFILRDKRNSWKDVEYCHLFYKEMDKLLI